MTNKYLIVSQEGEILDTTETIIEAEDFVMYYKNIDDLEIYTIEEYEKFYGSIDDI